MKKLNTTLHYCRSKKSTGKPIIVTEAGKKRKFVKMWQRTLYNTAGDEVLIRMAFNNSEGMAKRQGATTVLQIWE